MKDQDRASETHICSGHICRSLQLSRITSKSLSKSELTRREKDPFMGATHTELPMLLDTDLNTENMLTISAELTPVYRAEIIHPNPSCDKTAHPLTSESTNKAGFSKQIPKMQIQKHIRNEFYGQESGG